MRATFALWPLTVLVAVSAADDDPVIPNSARTWRVPHRCSRSIHRLGIGIFTGAGLVGGGGAGCSRQRFSRSKRRLGWPWPLAPGLLPALAQDEAGDLQVR